MLKQKLVLKAKYFPQFWQLWPNEGIGTVQNMNGRIYKNSQPNINRTTLRKLWPHSTSYSAKTNVRPWISPSCESCDFLCLCGQNMNRRICWHSQHNNKRQTLRVGGCLEFFLHKFFIVCINTCKLNMGMQFYAWR